MKYLLDTCTLISMTRRSPEVRNKILNVGFENCSISEISLAELISGAHKGGYEQHRHEIEFIKKSFKVIPITGVLDEYGSLRARLEKQGTPVENFDLMIAATAIVSKMVLVTHNTRHFDKIPGLEIRDWERE
ncbi:MAG: PIN domain-containing protein [Bacteroidales bacterium]|nr:PIN domain-containing protein [Bacteroidales bacterium]